MRQEIKSKKLTWIDIKGPTEEDMAWLKENYNLHPLVLKEILPQLDYPKIENFGDYLFIVFFYPFFDKETSQTIPFELDIIVAKDYIITNHYKDIVPLKAIFDQCNLYEDIKEEFTDEGTAELLHRILKQIFLAGLPKLSHIKQNTDEIEEAIFQKKYAQAVQGISLLQRDLIGFQRILEPQGLVLANLVLEGGKFFGKKTLPYFHSLLNLYHQVENLLLSQAKTVNALDSTNQSLLTTRTNEIVRILTIFSVVVFPMTFLANFFGMNIETLAFLKEADKIFFVSGLMTITTLVFLLYFQGKKWR